MKEQLFNAKFRASCLQKRSDGRLKEKAHRRFHTKISIQTILDVAAYKLKLQIEASTEF